MEGVLALKEYYKDYVEKTSMTNLPRYALYEKIKRFREDIKVDKQTQKEIDKEEKKNMNKEELAKKKEMERKINEAYYNQMLKDKEKLTIFDNLAEYSDYIYKLTLDDKEFQEYSRKNRKAQKEKMRMALELLKRSNDIAGKKKLLNLL